MFRALRDRVWSLVYRRNSKFPATERRFIAANPTCVWCRGKSQTAHHGYPVHVYPELEMDQQYWVPTCKAHHRPFCHNKNWSLWVELKALLRAARLMKAGDTQAAWKIITDNTLGPKLPI